MVNLDSPIVTLGALFVAGNSPKGREFTGGETGKGLVAGGFGGASAEWLGDQVNNLAGGTLPVTTELGQALAGAAISKWGDPVPQNNAIARGILYNTSVQMMQEMGVTAGDLFGQFGGGGGGGGSSTAAAPAGNAASAPSPSPSPSRQTATHSNRRGEKVF